MEGTRTVAGAEYFRWALRTWSVCNIHSCTILPGQFVICVMSFWYKQLRLLAVLDCWLLPESRPKLRVTPRRVPQSTLRSERFQGPEFRHKLCSLIHVRDCVAPTWLSYGVWCPCDHSQNWCIHYTSDHVHDQEPSFRRRTSCAISDASVRCYLTVCWRDRRRIT